MEPHGKASGRNAFAIIPARYESQRLPGKLLLEIGGKPLILHTLEQVGKAGRLTGAMVATDDTRIFDAVTNAGGEAVMTAASHTSGSDRVAEVAAMLPEGSVIVNVQGDEPLVAPATIDALVKVLMADNSVDVATACEPLTSLHGELLNFNVVKVVRGQDGRALYFSRSPVPFPRDASLRYGGNPNLALESEPALFEHFRKHVGIYAYRREYLLKFARLAPTRLEELESLEQLRAVEDGAVIMVADALGRSIGVDTEGEFRRVKDIIECGVDFRRARREDLPRVAAVHVESWQRSFADIAPRDFLDGMNIDERLERYSSRRENGSYAMLVAEHDTAGIIGFADFGTPVLDVRRDAQIFSFYLLPEFQRKGLGERLFRHCVAELAEWGVSSLCLDSLELSPYRRFYEKMGAQILGRGRHKLGNAEFVTVIYGWDDVSGL